MALEDDSLFRCSLIYELTECVILGPKIKRNNNINILRYKFQVTISKGVISKVKKKYIRVLLKGGQPHYMYKLVFRV